ncbi:BMP family ABC transporter substrate-binding protein [Gemella sp. GH3]|uniref:BMP family lipoprotein n=1 Tax=unclassified Gemella TaxID=2624949 RepID=UPI0015CFF936|nr:MULTISPECIES: BMP family ABC transporter substrate-binding protein [unclassified Gemella]MBF0713170.1 BMP family ABC transporter substrate-binding protein [Gemella sp. GH3.1]NYS50122.1 BMP family ABC transporter substrate-binding protein [Gemella sp. GH3]
MKKILKQVAILVSIILIFIGCSSKNKESEDKSSYKIGVVVGEGGVKDKSFNQANVEAVQSWAKENDATAHPPIESKSAADINTNLQNVSSKSDIVSVAGYDFEKELPKIAEKNKDVKYIYIDMEAKGDNIVSAVFKEQEAGYLAGYVAALQSKTGKVGFIGGLKIPPVAKFGLGFVQGAKEANPNIEVIYNYSGSFADINKGKTIAATMYDEGADVIFTAAGNTGNGAIKEAQERAVNDLKDSGEIKHWVIGVDKDQYEEGTFKAKDKDGKDVEKSVILTSAMKKVDVAVKNILDKIKAGTFQGNTTLIFGIKENGLTLPNNNPNLSEDIASKVKAIMEKISSEEIKVKDDEKSLTESEKMIVKGEL